MKTVPASLIVDDGGPVNLFFFHDPAHAHELTMPVSFTRQFIRVCERTGIKGKFSVVPMPGGLGRIDRKLNRIPSRAVREFIAAAVSGIAPRFSITPEILTHYRAYDQERDLFAHQFEDLYFSSLDAEKISSYVGLALEILDHVGLTPSGVTSPWYTGIDNEENYAAGIGMAFRRVLDRKNCFYFLHSQDQLTRPLLMCDTDATGRVVSVPANAGDAFWGSQNPATLRAAETGVRKQIDALLSPDGKHGKLRELFEAGLPLTIVTHWQSLFSDGRGVGLAGLEVLADRINRVFGGQIQWMTLEELSFLA